MQREPELLWDEVNLAFSSFSRLSSHDKRTGSFTEWQAVGLDGVLHQFYREITVAEPQRRLPLPFAEHLLVVLMTLWREQGEGNEIKAHLGDILRRLGKKADGRGYDRLKEGLNELHFVRIRTNAWWNRQQGTYEEVAIEFFDSASYDAGVRGGRAAFEVRLNQEFVRLLRTGKAKPVDGALLANLNAVGQKTLRLVDAHLYLFGALQVKLRDFCIAGLNMSPRRMTESDQLRLYQAADQQLRKAGFGELHRESSGADGTTLNLSCLIGAYELISGVRDGQYFASHLHRRGVRPMSACQGLCAGVPAEQLVKTISDYDAGYRRGAIKSPGWLRSALEKSKGVGWSDSPF